MRDNHPLVDLYLPGLLHLGQYYSSVMSSMQMVETTVSLHHLAPLPEDTFHPNSILPEPNIQVDNCSLPCDELLSKDLSGAPPQEIPTIPNAEDAPPF